MPTERRPRRPLVAQGLRRLVLVVASPPSPWWSAGTSPGSLLVTTERRQVEHPVSPHQLLDSAAVGRVRVVHEPILKRERAHPRCLLPGVVGVAEVVLGAVAPLLLRE